MSWRETYREHLTPAGQLKRTSSPELKTEVFIARAREVHGDKYDYSKAIYTSADDKISIICLSHGEFNQRAIDHLKGRGCSTCALDRGIGPKPDTIEDFIRKAKAVHGDFYDYSRVKYSNSKTKIEIVCPLHGPFLQRPNDHQQGHKCPSCSGNKKRTKGEFISIATTIHRSAYTYSNVEYINNSTKVLITCPVHGDFEQTPKAHLNGQGCPHCAVSNQDTIYLIEYLSAGTRLGTKVGITNNFDQRLSKLRSASPYDVAPIQCWIVDNPREMETKVLKQFTRAGNLGASFEGSTEILEEPTEQIAQFIEELVYASI